MRYCLHSLEESRTCSNTSPFFLLKSIEVHTFKNIGIAKNSQADYALRWSLQKAGMKPSDVNMIVLAPPVAVPAYQRNQIDGYYVWDVWGARLEASGAKLVQRAVDDGFPSSSI